MIARRRGSLLFTTAPSAERPMQMTGSFGVAGGALLNYVRLLHDDLAADNIYVGVVSGRRHRDPRSARRGSTWPSSHQEYSAYPPQTSPSCTGTSTPPTNDPRQRRRRRRILPHPRHDLKPAAPNSTRNRNTLSRSSAPDKRGRPGWSHAGVSTRFGLTGSATSATCSASPSSSTNLDVAAPIAGLPGLADTPRPRR